jgi:hypothetical protein
MMMKDADHSNWLRQSVIEQIRGNALDLVSELQKLRVSFGGHGPFGAAKLIHRRAADRAVDGVGRSLVNHRKFERHPFDVVAYYPVPLQRHRSPPTPAPLKRSGGRQAIPSQLAGEFVSALQPGVVLSAGLEGAA